MHFVLLLSLLFGKVDLVTQRSINFLIDKAIRTDWVVCKQEQKVNHAHMRVRDTLLTHGLLFERLDQIFESICALRLIVHLLFDHQSINHPPHIILICVLIRVVANVAHQEFFSN